MRSRPCLSLLLLLALAGFAQGGQAQQRWLNGSFGFIPGIACVTFTPETAVTAYAAYWGGTSPLFPQTGDVTYVQAVAGVVGNPCAGGDTLGLEFFLPPGAELAVSAQTPVRCIARRLSDGRAENVPLPGNTGACSQTPANGPNGGLQFGFGAVASGWTFEINVPVRFTRVLNGLGEPPQNWLRARVSSSNGNVTVQQPVVVGYRAVVNYPAPSATFLGLNGAGERVFRLTSFIFNNFQAGTAFIDVAASPGGPFSQISSAAIPGTGSSFAVNTDASLVNTFNGTVYWRTRFAPSGGGEVTGPLQQFVASGGTPAAFALTLNKGGAGTGGVSSDPQGLSCGATCAQSFTGGTVVTLTATPDPGSTFTGWGGCAGVAGNPVCTVTMDQARTVTANFAVAPPLTTGQFSITTSGLPGGATASIPVTGPNNYSRTFTILSGTGQSVSTADAGQYAATPPPVSFGGATYVASPATQSFVVPGGGNPTFTVQYQVGRSLTLSRSGPGSGTVTSNPAGINCGTTCAFTFADGASVTLTPTPAAGSVFAGWGGACSGTGACTVTMSAAQTVTATFNAAPAQALTVSRAGTGQGSVSSTPAGISCGATCTANFAQGSAVSLSAAPAGGSTFVGWGGACSGSGACSVTMDAAKSVTATFAAAPAGLSLTAARPANAPADATRLKGDTGVPILAFTLSASQATALQSVTLQAAGSGNDALDLTAVRLIRDANANGQIDAGETAAASGTFAADDGSLTLTPAAAVALAAGPTQFIVAVDISTSLARRPAVQQARSLPALPAPLLLALLPMLLFGAWRLRSLRAACLALALALTLAACGGGNTTPVNRTYQISLSALSAQGGPSVSGLPVQGATLTVQR